MLVSFENSSYICNAAPRVQQDMIRKRFGYSTSVNLDNSLVCLEYGNVPLGMDVCYRNICSLRCERLFLFNTQAVESPQVE